MTGTDFKLNANRALAILLLAAAAALHAQTTDREKALCSQANKITGELAQITGLQMKHEVPCGFINRDQVNSFLKKRVQEVAKPEDIRAEELALKKFGLVPPDFDLASTTVDLLTEQAAAFYDYDKKKLFVTDSTSPETQEPVLAHELAHALADQNFDLGRFIKQGRKSDDGSTARMAVMEGQATWLMSEFLARKLGQSLRTSPMAAEMMAAMSESAGGQFPVFDKAPLFLQRSLLFPYTAGMRFQQKVLEAHWPDGFGMVFRNPPISSQQILHPEKYLANVKPTDPDLPKPDLPRGFKSLVGGIMGEMEHSILLEQYLGKETATSLAPHWRGCNFEVREQGKRGGRVVLLYSVEWDTPEAAARYFDAYKQVLKKKWKQFNVAADSPGRLDGTGDDGRFELRLNGAIMTSVEGLE